MRCRDSNGTNETRTFPSDYTSFGNNSFLTADFAQRYHTWRMWNETDSIVVEEAPSRYTGLQVLFKPCPRLLAGRTPVDYDVAVNTTLYRPVERRRCETVPATYDVRVSFLNGVQTVEYNTSDIRPLVEQDTDPEEVPHWQERYNVLALGHAMALNFVGNGVGVSRPWLSFDGDVPKPTTLVLDNGTQVEEACWGTWGNGLAVIPGEWQSKQSQIPSLCAWSNNRSLTNAKATVFSNSRPSQAQSHPTTIILSSTSDPSPSLSSTRC